jgi:signal transduction histidine kinase
MKVLETSRLGLSSKTATGIRQMAATLSHERRTPLNAIPSDVIAS